MPLRPRGASANTYPVALRVCGDRRRPPLEVPPANDSSDAGSGALARPVPLFLIGERSRASAKNEAGAGRQQRGLPGGVPVAAGDGRGAFRLI